MNFNSSFGKCKKCNVNEINHIWEKITVPLANNSYEILIGPGLLMDIPEDLQELNLGSRYFIITDSNVAELLGHDLLRLLYESQIPAHMITFPSGEESKNMATITEMARQMVADGADRHSAIIALGGGVAGDMAAFLSSIYMRGIPFVQIPTTLLAQVDSSVGGKTGVDLPEGKNLLGTFCQPERVYSDIGVLATLTESEYRNGLAEVIKYGMIRDADFFAYLEKNTENILKLEPETVAHMVKVSCCIKADVVSKDEKEGGLRRILNFGHTIGHAIETAADYKMPHGEAVSLGMMAISDISVHRDLMDLKDYMRLCVLLENFSLPLKISYEIKVEDIMASMKNDKKSKDGKISFVLGKGIGDTLITQDVSDDEVEAAVRRLM